MKRDIVFLPNSEAGIFMDMNHIQWFFEQWMTMDELTKRLIEEGIFDDELMPTERYTGEGHFGVYLYTPMKMTMSGRGKLTTYFSGEEDRFVYDSVVKFLGTTAWGGFAHAACNARVTCSFKVLE